jgi:hypothetical protein
MKKWKILLGCGAALSLALMAWPQRHYANDDTYVHLRIVRNIVESGEFAYNPGEPTYTTTSPLWNIVMATVCLPAKIASGAGPDYLLWSQVTAYLLSLAAAAALAALARPRAGGWAWVAGGLYLLDPYLSSAVACGMEMPLFALLASLALAAAGSPRFGPRAWPSAALCSLLLQVRPEAVTVTAAAFLLALSHNGNRLRRGALFALCLAALSTPWLVYYRLHFGSFVTNTVLAKSLDSAGRLPFSRPATMLQVLRLLVQVYAAPAAVVAGTLAWAARRGGARADAAKRCWPEASVVLGILSLYLAFLKEGSISSRYLLTFAPFLYGLVAASLGMWRSCGWRGARGVAALLALLLLGLDGTALPGRLRRDRQIGRAGIETATWIARNTPERATVFTGGIGYLGYYSGRRILDDGLADPAGAALRGGRLTLAELLSLRRPDYAATAEPVPPAPEAVLQYVSRNLAKGRAWHVWRLDWQTPWRNGPPEGGQAQ